MCPRQLPRHIYWQFLWTVSHVQNSIYLWWIEWSISIKQIEMDFYRIKYFVSHSLQRICSCGFSGWESGSRNVNFLRQPWGATFTTRQRSGEDFVFSCVCLPVILSTGEVVVVHGPGLAHTPPHYRGSLYRTLSLPHHTGLNVFNLDLTLSWEI